MTTITACIYVDTQDATNVGWAWRVVTVDDEGDRHEESGGCDDAADGIQQVRAYASAAPSSLAGWTYSDGGDGSYDWTGVEDTDEVTDEQIATLRQESAIAGDWAQVGLCSQALGWFGSSDEVPSAAVRDEARTECERVIREARAQV